MRTILSSIGPLLAGIVLLTFGIGLLGTVLGMRMAQASFSPLPALDNGKRALTAGKGLTWVLIGPKQAFLIQGEERVGVLVEYHLRLADSGINVYAANGTSSGHGRFGYIVWVRPEDYEKAAKALGI